MAPEVAEARKDMQYRDVEVVDTSRETVRYRCEVSAGYVTVDF